MTAALERHQTPLVYAGAATAAVLGGLLVARSDEGVSLALVAIAGLIGLAFMLSLPVRTLFLGWLFLAPIFQVAAEDTAIGLAGVWALYTIPAVIFMVMTVARLGSAPFTALDVVPAAYVVFVLASAYLTSDEFATRTVGVVRYLFVVVAIGVVVYYFLTLGPGRRVDSESIMKVLLAAGVVQACFALFELATNWRLWPSAGWDKLGGTEYARIVGTLANPAVTGAFLGAVIVTATAVLVFHGPRSLRTLSIASLVLCVPALLATLTRAPILATLVAVVLMLLASRARYVALVALLAGGIALFALFPSIRESSLYERRVGVSNTIGHRAELQDWSLRLWRQEPLLGFGWGSFDEVKNRAQFSADGISTKTLRYYTSHNSYLTILVELGAVGLALLVLPFLVIGYRGLARARSPGPDQWIVTGSLAAILVIALTGTTLDFRFFSIAWMLPWLYLALLRRATTTAPSPAASA